MTTGRRGMRPHPSAEKSGRRVASPPDPNIFVGIPRSILRASLDKFTQLLHTELFLNIHNCVYEFFTISLRIPGPITHLMYAIFRCSVIVRRLLGELNRLFRPDFFWLVRAHLSERCKHHALLWYYLDCSLICAIRLSMFRELLLYRISRKQQTA